MKRWKDEVGMLIVLEEVISKTSWLEPGEQNEMIKWIERQKKARQAVGS